MTNRFKNADKNKEIKNIVGATPAPAVEAIKEEKKIKVKKDKVEAKEKKATGVKTFGVKKKENTKETAILSVNLTQDVKEALEHDKNTSNKTFSAIVTELLTNIYDEDTNTFIVSVIPNPEIEDNKTTLNLPKKIKEAIDANAENHNMKAYEYFNKLMESMLK
ncbi:hypothetical protein [Clostridium perfringens]|uniref:hypothetical protein n=1 Tax=Clostridium perfringens TaxID=1502 RepID=UPI0018E4D81C|nr:hypothetical protein [Clostridium perfringens]MBI5995662.1 hypothetical protein [Clostridium perfringens]MBI6001348.1 hypothetical protein [Clostridium perfringens]